MLGYWFFTLKKDDVLLKPILNWLLYPALYITFIMLRGHFSGFYPYPFLNVNDIGYHKTIINIGIVFAVASVIIISLIAIGKTVIKNKQKPKIYEN
jgi:tellurite resistance protein TehA-like permease